MGGSAKSRRVADAASSEKMMRPNALQSASNEYTTTTALNNVVRPLAVGMMLLILIWLAMTFLGKFQLWMTAAGVVMILLSVLSAIQEFKSSTKTTQSYQDLLDETVESCSGDKISLPHLSPAKATMKATVKNSTPVVVNHRRNMPHRQSSKAPQHVTSQPHGLNIAPSPAIVTNPVLLESGGVSTLTTQKSSPASNRRKSEDCVDIDTLTRGRRNSSANELGNKLVVLHCGTVIDIQGSHGFIIPHDLDFDAGFKTVGKKNSKSSTALTRQLKLPLVIPFDLNEDEVAVRQELSVGKTVEFAFSEYSSDCKVCALHVTPVSSDEEIVKSRHALLSCKQAREQSFAKAMCDLKMISPRNEPVKHVDLIKYAEKLDDHELPFEQFI
uniref:Uncharacterized protein n=1 Tax=Globisporangium ultimum (strain ATCC 200006 / CBS 805.95 / DAOM BR144) TaxID=431595 RepID=K3WM42_GLOUD